MAAVSLASGSLGYSTIGFMTAPLIPLPHRPGKGKDILSNSTGAMSHFFKGPRAEELAGSEYSKSFYTEKPASSERHGKPDYEVYVLEGKGKGGRKRQFIVCLGICIVVLVHAITQTDLAPEVQFSSTQVPSKNE
ncbi:hypothetical protein EV356DRAFT_496845 [Viridothelium virens]|uniref:Uncharacterized protein n=1 Tax=Viridothelium virens TaxID=1048519 RepID=A0A6A6HIG6_VIRVR|nr:hypothetical protein EV356DRAFT_496845 [Viridothelium virens]